MKVLILEDETLMARRLEELLRQQDPGIEVLARIPSVEKAAAWLGANPPPDLILMDIHLEDDLAFHLFERVKITTPVIFITAYDQYMVQAFRVSGIDYLLKPVQPDELAGALDKFRSLQNHFRQPDLNQLRHLLGSPKPTGYKERFMVTSGNRIRSLEPAEIAYFFVENKVTYLVTVDKVPAVLDYSLEKLMPLLDPARFFRINRQYIVSFASLQTVETNPSGKLRLDLQPKARHEVYVSTDRMAEFKAWLGK